MREKLLFVIVWSLHLSQASFFSLFQLWVLSDKPTGRLTVCEQCCVCFRGQTEYAIRVWGLQSRTTLTLPPNRTKTVQLWMQTHSLDAGQHCATHHELLSAVVSNELMSWQALCCFQKEMTLSHVLWWAPAKKEEKWRQDIVSHYFLKLLFWLASLLHLLMVSTLDGTSFTNHQMYIKHKNSTSFLQQTASSKMISKSWVHWFWSRKSVTSQFTPDNVP